MTQTNKGNVLKKLIEGKTLKGKIKWWLYAGESLLGEYSPESINKGTMRKLFDDGFLVESPVEDNLFLREYKLNPEKLDDAKRMVAKMLLDRI